MGFRRARRPEHKEERRCAILEAAAQLMAEHGLAAASLNAIGRRAGLAKSNLYRYFESREAIFLSLYKDDTVAWADSIAAALQPLAGCDDAEVVADALTDATLKHPRWCELTSKLASVLEQNLSEDAVREFKLAMVARIAPLLADLRAALPRLTEAQSLDFIVAASSLIAGLWPNTHPAPAVARAQEHPLLMPLKRDFATDLRFGIAALLRGTYAIADARP